MKNLLLFIFLSIFINSQSTSAQVEMGNLLDTWSVDTLIGSRLYDNVYNEVWGLTNKGREYAIIGSTYGTHFIDVTDPSNIIEVAVVKGQDTTSEIVHRDFHDYKGYLYSVAQEGESTMQIIDYSYLPDSVAVLYDSDEVMSVAHNIFIDTSSAVMYAGVTNGAITFPVAMRTFDLSDPLNPSIIKSYNRIDGYLINHMHDAYVVNDTAYLNCGPSGLVIADFSDVENPINLATLETFEYPQSGYNHSGWLSQDRKTYVMADETWGTDMKVFDVSQLPDITVIDTIDAGSESELSIAHNQIIHDGLLYCAYYYDGLQVWDIRDPENIERIMHYPTTDLEYDRTYEGAWGVYPFLPSGNIIVSDMQNGLFVIEAPKLSSSDQDFDLIKDEWSIYPSPAQNHFSIKTKLDLSKYKIELLDQNGKTIQYLDKTSNYNFNGTSGVYYVRLSQDKISSIKTLVIAH